LKYLKHSRSIYAILIFILALVSVYFIVPEEPRVKLKKGTSIILLGNNLGSRMTDFGFFETELHLRYPDSMLYIRNMCDGGNTPGFRPHSARPTPWAFPGAEKFQDELAESPRSEGFNEYPDQWLSKHRADIIIAFFGYNESFQGKAGLENFKSELEAFIKHTANQKYNGVGAPQLVLVSPIAFEDLSDKYDLPNGKLENGNLLVYSEAMREIAVKNRVPLMSSRQPNNGWKAGIRT
jgi:hypothetical protein